MTTIQNETTTHRPMASLVDTPWGVCWMRQSSSAYNAEYLTLVPGVGVHSSAVTLRIRRGLYGVDVKIIQVIDEADAAGEPTFVTTTRERRFELATDECDTRTTFPEWCDVLAAVTPKVERFLG